ncbi:hypothetical protein FE840_000680 [Peteryoungia desertarenae]|uniref:Uncharacterized protein n=1 Tax=Peteryoungia desertarenae TaxID=1813451 RepID=A0ABX6QI02_9HYPH|nr:hypothetical protein [Peteryoungia desertarenae]QLF68193.1 hypothetical protein FE840_000680 [Peteryoungia desertarenae]
MTDLHSGAASAPTFLYAVDPEVLHPKLDGLCHSVLSSSFSTTALLEALSSGLADVSCLLRTVPAAEGRLIERGIGLIAGLNPDLVVLTENIRLPVTKAALDVVERNDPRNYASLTLDADAGGRRGYTPDLIIVNKKTRLAYVVDVKRSLSSYDAPRLQDLKRRMLAGALTVPDLLYREHHRLVAGEVQVVILDAQNANRDTPTGIWPVADLDHLLSIEGAGKAIAYLRRSFQQGIEQNWKQARSAEAQYKTLSEQDRRVGAAPWVDTPEPEGLRLRADNRSSRISDAAVHPDRPQVRIGFASLPGLRQAVPA